MRLLAKHLLSQMRGVICAAKLALILYTCEALHCTSRRHASVAMLLISDRAPVHEQALTLLLMSWWERFHIWYFFIF